VSKYDARPFILLCVVLWGVGCAQNKRPGFEGAVSLAGGGKVKQILWILRGVGGRVDWSPDGERIAFDKLGEDGYFDVWTMKPDGSDQECLTCDNPAVPQKHNGNPAWHPSGKYLVMQSLDEEAEGPLSGTDIYKVYTNPGAGFRNRLWLMTSDGEKAWPLTDGQDGLGVLHPHFSHSGSQLIWSQMISTEPALIGSWVIMLADITFEHDEPELHNVTVLQPGEMQWYETHGFSPDDSALLFTGMPFGGNEADFDIYVLNLDSQAFSALTDSALRQWDEHAHFSPDGTRIIWMSSMGIDQRVEDLHQLKVKTDYWIMNADGSHKDRLTHFNDSGAPEHILGRVIAADFAFSPDGKGLVAYLQDNPTKDRPGSIAVIELNAGP
jgi:Tol biopolymer transport system component